MTHDRRYPPYPVNVRLVHQATGETWPAEFQLDVDRTTDEDAYWVNIRPVPESAKGIKIVFDEIPAGVKLELGAIDGIGPG